MQTKILKKYTIVFVLLFSIFINLSVYAFDGDDIYVWSNFTPNNSISTPTSSDISNSADTNSSR